MLALLRNEPLLRQYCLALLQTMYVCSAEIGTTSKSACLAVSQTNMLALLRYEPLLSLYCLALPQTRYVCSAEIGTTSKSTLFSSPTNQHACSAQI